MYSTEIITVFLVLVSASHGGDVKPVLQNKDNGSRLIEPNDFFLAHDHPWIQLSQEVNKEADNVGHDTKTYNNTLARKKNKQIGPPLEFIKKISEYDVNDLLLNFVEGEKEDPFIASRFAEGSFRDSSTFAKDARCNPELKTVSLKTSDDPSVIYIPSCTRIEQCGGCCYDKLYTCRPKTTETLTFKVRKTRYTEESKLKWLGNEVVVVEKHTSCTCDCKVREQDCTAYQAYNPHHCQCFCSNEDEEEKCSRSKIKFWNSELCTCQCINIFACYAGYYFDQKECRCVQEPQRKIAIS